MIQRSQEILHFYLDKLQNCLQDIKYSRGGPLGIKLTKFNASTQYFDYMLEDPNFTDILQEQPQDVEDRNNYCVNEKGEDEIVLVMNDNAVPSFFKSQNGQLKSLNRTEINGFSGTDCIRKKRAKRKPMVYKSCTQCSVKYRFLGKLKYHMKVKHGLNAVICKICKIIVDNEEEYESHLQTHGEVYSCDKCHMVFKRRDAIDEHLQEHYNKKHVNKFTCFYCGRMLSLLKQKKDGRRKKFVCTKCDNSFVDERTLLWHSRLHTNERPYPCNICGRAFISLNRRNQHALCAHTAPTRRCPLCPALFHLNSMVNSHIKRVHLKNHRHRQRQSKHKNVYWKTETVPIQKLSVAIQEKTLELQAKQSSK
ncbi:unnamed protein product [Leptidea sinapis]|nr:unnamed protein product [Leptidea sinapis]